MQITRWLIVSWIALAVWLPAPILAKEKSGETGNQHTDYLGQMQKFYGFNTEAFDSVDWFLVIVMMFATITCVGAFIYLLYKIIHRILQSQMGKVVLFEKRFWVQVGVGMMLVLSFMAGLFFVFIEKMYDMFRL